MKGTDPPPPFVSLVDLLGVRAARAPERTAYVMLADGEREEARWSWAELDRHARAVACALRDRADPGDRVVLLFPPGLEFIGAFFGCLYAGVVAVPCDPPRPRRDPARLRSIVADCAPRLVLTGEQHLERLRKAVRSFPELDSLEWLAPDGSSIASSVPALDGAWAPREAEPRDLAFLQYTSGSTAAPKGVMVTHDNLVHNQEMIRRAFSQDEKSVVVSWLPLYHDMGLIGAVLQPLYAGARCVLMSPVAFLQRPLRWLQAVARYSGTTSGGPNFAFDLCVDRVTSEERSRLDLSSWRVAFSGAEPVRVSTLERFAATFAPCGFDPRAFFPCYGLAEATLFVTGGFVARKPVVRSYDVGPLERGRARRASPGEGGRRARPLTSCGRPWLGQRLEVVDPETGLRCPPGRVGEVWVSGPSVASGYWRRPDETARDFEAALGDDPSDSDRFLRTGDLGFLDDGELFVTGRLKDLIILRGRNLYPQDVELVAERSHPGLRPGCSAAFSVDVDDEECLVLVQELDPRCRDEPKQVAIAARDAVAREHEAAVFEVVLVEAGGVPKTSSGKVRRRACRAAYRAGELPAIARLGARYAPKPTVRPLGSPPPAELGSLPQTQRRSAVERWLRSELARLVSVAPEDLEPARSLTSLGLDSLAAVELQQRLAATWSKSPSVEDLLGGMTLGSVAASLAVGAPRSGPRQPPRPVRVAPEAELPLSQGQRALWFLHRLDPESGAYNIVVAGRAAHLPDGVRLRRAFELLLARHPQLGATFGSRDGEPFQRLGAGSGLDFREENLGAGDDPGVVVAREGYRPFDLERGPLLRLRLYRLPTGGATLLLAVHHLVADFSSLSVLLRELSFLYAQGEASELPVPTATYRDFVRLQDTLLAGERGRRAWDYWLARLEGELPVLSLPTDRPRPPTRSDRGGARRIFLDPETVAGLRRLARESGSTFHACLLAGYQTLLHTLSGQDETLVGAPAAGRLDRAQAEVVGYFVSPVVLRGRFADRPTFSRLVRRTQTELAGALEHQVLPFPVLAARLEPERDPSRTPVFQAMLVFHRRPDIDRSLAPDLGPFAMGEAGGRLALGDLVVESVRLPEVRVQVDLSLFAAETAAGLLLSLHYDGVLFDATTAERMLRRLGALLASAVQCPALPVAELPELSTSERHQLLREWNDTECGPSAPVCVHELVLEAAHCHPEATAVVLGSEHLSYGELARRTRRVARRLRRLGVGPEMRVGVSVSRTIGLPVALLGVLEAGGAYVPLDPGYPEARLRLLAEDAGVDVVITDPEAAGRASAVGRRLVLDLDAELAEGLDEDGIGDRWPSRLDPGRLAYVMYTSGSTGVPKGVAIEHRSAVALVRWAVAVYGPRRLSRVLAGTSIGFDLSVFELFATLACGGTTVIAESALDLIHMAGASRLSLVNTVPSVLQEVVARRSLPGSPVVNLAGEPLPESLAAELHSAGVAALFNLYGPSESTTYSTFTQVGARGTPTLGRPVAGTRVHLADAGGCLAGVGEIGEICLAGRGLARGYLERPGATAGRFVPDPFAAAPGGRLYRTGDLARRRADGDLEFLGRIDHQVKVRGVRIELGDVEAALRSHPRVREAVAAVQGGSLGERRLVAYAVPAGGAPAVAELRSFLQGRLPEPMVPSAFVVLDRLPLTSSGKVDRRALPAAPRRGGAATAAPRSELEALLAGVWAELLGRDQVGVDEDFFEIGGHSLLAVRALARVASTCGVDLPLGSLFKARSVRALARRIEEAGASGPGGSPPLERIGREAPLSLSFAQERLWFLQQMEPASAAYHVPGALELRGPLNLRALAWAIDRAVFRHEALRTRFPAVDGVPHQEIAPRLSPGLPVVDLVGLGSAAGEPERRRLLERAARCPFDLERGPLLRTLALRLGQTHHAVLLVLHHLVSDGVSLELLLREIGRLYGLASRGEPDELPLPAFQYADYAAWQRRALGETFERDLEYWRRGLEGVPALELPLDRPRSARTASGRLRLVEVPPELVSAVRRTAVSRGATPFMALLAAFSVLLSRYTGEIDLPVGTPMATRRLPGSEEIVGLLINTVVVRCDLSGDPTAEDLLGRLRQRVLEAHAHGELPFERLVEDLQPSRSLLLSPLFQVMLAFFSGFGPPPLEGLEARSLAVDTGAAKFDLTLWLREEGDRLEGWINYRDDLFDVSTIDRLVAHLQSLLAGLVERPDVPVSELPLLSRGQRHQILREWCAPAGPEPARTFDRLVALQAGRTPDRIAVAQAGQALSYWELERRASAVAAGLAARGVGLEAVVALVADRSSEALVAVLGILAAGAAYLPLDPSHPPTRLGEMVEKSGARHLMVATEAPPESLAPSIPRLAVGDLVGADDEEWAPRTVPDGAAYVLYTSGSTGAPKGVVVRHAAVTNLAWALRDRVYGEVGGGGLRVGCNAPLTFDASIKQIAQLALGHSLHPLPEAVRRDGEALARHFAERPLDVVDLTPAQLEILMAVSRAPGGGGGLRDLPATVLVGGEAMSPELWRRLAENRATRFVNVYGPTECTVDATACTVEPHWPRPVLGRCLANVRAVTADAELRLLPPRVPGELLIGGVGVARGYLGRPGLTAERFVPDPFSSAGARLYRTGDRARTLPDGGLELLGRLDRQVKLRGLRLEPGEVEAALESHPWIHRALVTVREDVPGDRRLVAYVVTSGLENAEELVPHLRTRLPEPMIPTAFVRLESIPLTSHGKVDYRALPRPDGAAAAPGAKHVPPSTSLERRLARLWEEILGVEGAGLRDDFFASGGHSLLAVRLVSRVRAELQVELPVRVLFETPTLGELVASVEAGQSSPAGEPGPALRARRRGGRDLEELMNDVGSLSAGEVRRRLKGAQASSGGRS